jgi:hypothetical protein
VPGGGRLLAGRGIRQAVTDSVVLLKSDRHGKAASEAVQG